MIGEVLALSSAITLSIAAVVQRLGLKKLKYFSIRKAIRNRIWLVGILLGGIGGLLNYLAINKTYLYVVQVIMTSNIIITMILESLLTNDKLNIRQVISIVLITIGLTMVMIG